MVQQPGIGELLTPTIPLEFATGGRLAPAAAPRLGQHTDEVLSELLRLEAAEIGRLHDKGIVS
jgi:2-methylfumaryl-CoA isomerase